MTTTCIVLDINGVLCAYAHQPLTAWSYAPDAVMPSGKQLWLRPHVREFIAFLFRHFSVGVWTSNAHNNAWSAVHFLFTPEQQKKLKFVYTRDECNESEKDLRKVRAAFPDIGKLIMIDDTTSKIYPAGGDWQLIHVSTFDGSKRDDDKLIRVLEYLQVKYV
jgi:hypothetical protein